MSLIDDVERDLEKKSHRYVWVKYANYNPYGTDCPFSKMPKHPSDCNCDGTGILIHKKQVEFHENKAMFRLLVAGRGGGKSKSGAAEMVRYIMENPGANVLIVAPNYGMLQRAALEYLAPSLPPGMIKSSNMQRHEIVLTTGGKVWLASAEHPDSLRGPTVSAVWIDEASFLSEETYDIVIACLRQNGYPLRLWATSTPKGKNYLWKLWVHAPSKNPELKEDYWYTQFATKDNPWYPKKMLRSLEAKYGSTRWGRQELLGSFESFEGQIYPQFSMDIHVGDWQKEAREGRLQFKKMLYGVDWGFSDEQVILVAGIDSDRRVYILEEFYQSGVDVVEAALKAREMVGRWGDGLFVCDSADQQKISTFNKMSLPSHDAYKPIDEGLSAVASRLLVKEDGKPRLFIDSSCVSTISEIETYHFKEREEGDNSKPEPAKGQKDHSMDTLRYIVMDVDGGEQSWGYVKDQAVLDAINRAPADKFQTHYGSMQSMPRGKDVWSMGRKRMRFW